LELELDENDSFVELIVPVFVGVVGVVFE